MIKTDNFEKSARLLESWHAFADVLPIYDPEAEKVFRASFGMDMTKFIPDFCLHLGFEMVKNEKSTHAYLHFFGELLKYVNGERDDMPTPQGTTKHEIGEVRARAEKCLRAWKVEPA